MGGHGIARGDHAYADAVALWRSLTVATGGGSGTMEAANLGAWSSAAFSVSERNRARDLPKRVRELLCRRVVGSAQGARRTRVLDADASRLAAAEGSGYRPPYAAARASRRFNSGCCRAGRFSRIGQRAAQPQLLSSTPPHEAHRAETAVRGRGTAQRRPAHRRRSRSRLRHSARRGCTRTR